MATAGRRTGTYRQATRLLRLLDHLRSLRYGVGLADLASAFGVTERQVRRDLLALGEAGYRLDHSPSAEGRARVRLDAPATRGVLLSLRERYGLLAARRVFDVLDGTPLHDDVRSIYAKVAATLPERDRADLEAFGERFLYVQAGGLKPYRGREQVLDGLLTGVIRRLAVRYRYHGASGPPSSGLLQPYAMVLYNNGLYVIGRATKEGKPGAALPAPTAAERPRVFAAERFSGAEHVRGTTFKVPADFKLDQFFQGAFGIFLGDRPQRVVVDFAPAVRALIEARLWHPRQTLTPLPGGGVQLAFDVENIAQVVPWVLEWGLHARAREPEALVARVAKELRSAAAQYGK